MHIATDIGILVTRSWHAHLHPLYILLNNHHSSVTHVMHCALFSSICLFCLLCPKPRLSWSPCSYTQSKFWSYFRDFWGHLMWSNQRSSSLYYQRPFYIALWKYSGITDIIPYYLGRCGCRKIRCWRPASMKCPILPYRLELLVGAGA